MELESDVVPKAEPTPAEITNKTLIADVALTISGVRLCLLRQNTEWLFLQLSNMQAAVKVSPDGLIHVGGYLANILVSDPTLNKWGNFVSLEGERVSFFASITWCLDSDLPLHSGPCL